MHAFIRQIALGVAAVTVASGTLLAGGTALAAGTASAIGTGSAADLFRPPVPEVDRFGHRPGEPCADGHQYQWDYDTHYGWGWVLTCR